MSRPWFRLRSDWERDKPAILLRDTPEDVERLAAALDEVFENPPLMTISINGNPTDVIDNDATADAIIAALKETP